MECEVVLEIDEKQILEDTSRYQGHKLLFPVDSKPPWYIVVAYALQVWIYTMANNELIQFLESAEVYEGVNSGQVTHVTRC